MKTDLYTKIILTVIAACLVWVKPRNPSHDGQSPERTARDNQ